jgi:hypothetical protein
MRKIVSMVVLLGVIFVAGRLFGVYGEGPVPLEIHYLLGDPPVCAGLEVTFTPAGKDEVAARFETTLVGPDVKQSARIPGGDERVDITLVAPDGTRRTVTRTITAQRNAVVRLDLSRETAVRERAAPANEGAR